MIDSMPHLSAPKYIENTATKYAMCMVCVCVFDVILISYSLYMLNAYLCRYDQCLCHQIVTSSPIHAHTFVYFDFLRVCFDFVFSLKPKAVSTEQHITHQIYK